MTTTDRADARVALNSDRVRLLGEVAPPLLLGVLAALMIVGVDGIDPTNVGWSQQGDSATHYLGWRFFRESPWGFPLGSNPAYGLEIGSSIFYSDSLPLLAFFFKPFSAWLPSTFQYLGLWTASCLVLQAWFAWKILSCFEDTQAPWVRFFATGLFVFAPPLIIRISGHSALVAHWMILAALYLYLRHAKWTWRLAWPALVLASTLVHSYLFVMIMAIWFASMLRRIVAKSTTTVTSALDAVLVFGLSLLGLWQAGFFMVSVEPAGGYGDYGTNLFALANPDIYSHVIRPLATPLLGFHEGFAFMGLGALAPGPDGTAGRAGAAARGRGRKGALAAGRGAGSAHSVRGHSSRRRRDDGLSYPPSGGSRALRQRIA